MRWSKFVNFYSAGDDVILFNSVNRAMNKLRQGDVSLIDRYLEGGQTVELDDETKTGISELFVDEFLVPDTYSEQKAFDAVRQSRDLTGTCVMYFIPTFDCNFRCPYCIVSSTNHDCNVSGDIMPLSEVRLAANWLKTYLRDNKLHKLTVELFGGEPLLGHQENMLFLTLLKEMEAEGIEMDFNMISNCYILTEKYLQELKSVGLKCIQCTIDGPREIHNKRRILTNNEETFDTIIRNIKRAHGYGIDLVIRINVDMENAPFIPELIDYLAGEGLSRYASIGVAPVDPPIGDKTMAGHTPEVMRYIPAIYDSLKKSGFLFRMWETFCGYGTKHFFVLCPDGELYNCPSYAGMEGYSVGSIHRGGFDEDRPGMHKIPSRCYSCSLVGVCSGGCRFTKEIHGHGDTFCMRNTHDVLVKNYVLTRFA